MASYNLYAGCYSRVIFQRLSSCQTSLLDRWKISVNDEERDKSEPVYKVTQSVPYNIINNYFSIGVVSTSLSFYNAILILSRHSHIAFVIAFVHTYYFKECILVGLLNLTF